MKEKFNLGWITSCSPLYSSKLPDWKHHDALLNKFTELGSAHIIVPIPQTGSTLQTRRLYAGDTHQLYHTLRSLDIEWYTRLHEISEVADTLDALVIDGAAIFQDITLLDDSILSGDNQYQYIQELIKSLLSKSKRVVLVDNDNVCVRKFIESEDNVLRKFYLEFKDDDNLYVLSPYDQSHLLGIGERSVHIPFEVDPRTLRDVTPVDNREYLLRYVGNNYYKSETHVPVFKALSQIGPVLINGKFWSAEDKLQSPLVDYRISVSLSHDNLYSIYGNSILGVSGFSSKHEKSLYHLRWKEMLISGTYIILDDSPYLKPLLPPQRYTFEDISRVPEDALRSYIEDIKKDYMNLVIEQRNMAMEFFDVDKWYPVWCKVLLIEESE